MQPTGLKSQYGPELDIVAPGDHIITTTITGTGWSTYNFNYIHRNGTSYATPLAGGIAALIIGVQPCFKGSEVREILLSTAEKKGSNTYSPSGPSDWNVEMGYGIVNAEKAVGEAYARGNRTCPEPSYWWVAHQLVHELASNRKPLITKMQSSTVFQTLLTIQFHFNTNLPKKAM